MLILLLSFLFYACQKEDFDDYAYDEKINLVEIKTIDFQEVLKKPALVKKLNLAPYKKLSDGDDSYVAISETSLLIKTEDITLIQDTLTQSYTFALLDTEDTDRTVNLYLTSYLDQENYYGYLIDYDLTEEEVDLVLEGELEGYTENITVTPFNVDLLYTSLSSGSGPCYKFEIIEHLCKGKNTHTVDHPDCEVTDDPDKKPYFEFKVYEVPCSDYGGGDNGSDYSPDFPGGDIISGGPGGGNNNNGGYNNPNNGNQPVDDTSPVNDSPTDGTPPGGKTRLNPKDRDKDKDECKTSKKDLKKVFPTADEEVLEDIANYINQYGSDFGIDTKEKLQHFLAQAGYESKHVTTGKPFGAFEENLNYRIEKLGVDYFGAHFNPSTDSIADPNKENPYDYEQYSGSTFVDHEKFANYVFDDANRGAKHKLGNINPGDGYKFRGRGIFQLTGRENYTEFNTFYQDEFDSEIDLIENPDLVASDTKIAVISALWYFKKKVNADNIDENTTVKSVTKKVQGKTEGLAVRKANFENAQEYIECL